MLYDLKRWGVGFAWLALLLAAGCARQQIASGSNDNLAEGWINYSLSEFDRAIGFFNKALAQAPANSEEALQALYGLATTWNLRRPGEDPEKAAQFYRQILETAPNHDLAAWSALGLARQKHLVPVGQDPDYPEVYKAYRGVMERYPGHLAAQEAFLYLNAGRLSTLTAPEARTALTALESYVQNPSNAFLGPAWSLMAVAQTTLGDQQKRFDAEVHSLELTEVDPTNPFTEFVGHYWNLATIAEFELGDFDQARKYYRKLIEEYPQDIRIYGARQSLRRMDEMEARFRAEFAQEPGGAP